MQVAGMRDREEQGGGEKERKWGVLYILTFGIVNKWCTCIQHVSTRPTSKAYDKLLIPKEMTIRENN
jgi:hypothetical protein